MMLDFGIGIWEIKTWNFRFQAKVSGERSSLLTLIAGESGRT